MTSPNLKPCPFCGGEASACPDPNNSTGWDIGCFSGKCEIEPHVWAVHRSTAEMHWNTRADAPELLALVAAVREIVSDAWGYDHLFETMFHAKVHDTLHSALAAYEALQ